MGFVSTIISFAVLLHHHPRCGAQSLILACFLSFVLGFVLRSFSSAVVLSGGSQAHKSGDGYCWKIWRPKNEDSLRESSLGFPEEHSRNPRL